MHNDLTPIRLILNISDFRNEKTTKTVTKQFIALPALSVFNNKLDYDTIVLFLYFSHRENWVDCYFRTGTTVSFILPKQMCSYDELSSYINDGDKLVGLVNTKAHNKFSLIEVSFDA